MLLTASSALLFYKSFNRRKELYAPALIFLTIGIASYQSLLAFFATTLYLVTLSSYLSGKVNFKNSFKILILGSLFALLSIALYYLILEFTVKKYLINYETHFFHWTAASPLKVAGWIFTGIYRTLIGIRGYPPLIFMAVIAAILSAIHIGRKNNKNKLLSGIKAFFLIVLMFVCSISFNIILGGFAPNRTQLAIPLFFAAAFAIYFTYSSKLEKFIINISVIFIIIFNASYASKLFIADYKMKEADSITVQRILDLIYDKAPGFYKGEIPVAFIGYHDYGNMSLLFDGRNDTLGGSFLNWYGETDRIYLLMTSLGIPTDIRIARGQQYENAKKYAETMPKWPDINSVQLYEGTVIVKLNGQ